MDYLASYLPWAIAAALYIEHGRGQLKLLLLTDTTKDGFAVCMLDDMSGKNGGGAAAAKLVALCFILGWPAFMAYGWIKARREIAAERSRG